MNKQIFIAAIFATAMLTIAVPSATAHAQNATTTTGQGPREFRHFEGHDHGGLLGLNLGVRSHIGFPFVRNNLGSAVVVSGSSVGVGGIAQPRIQDFAREHHDHFIFLNNRYVYLPSTIACPAGSQLVGDQCVVQSQILIQQEAPTILAEQQQAAPEVTTGQSTVTTTQSEVAPNISCQPGSTLVGNECQTTVQSTQTSAPIITCPTGTLLQGQTCIQQQQQIVVQPLPCPQCPEGSTLTNGQCIASALPSQVIVGSTPGEIIIEGHHFHHEGDLPFLRH